MSIMENILNMSIEEMHNALKEKKILPSDLVKASIEKAKEKNIRIIMDLVCNHTSTEHIWFKEAIKDKNSKYHDYYIFRDKPDNKKSSFGGSAWCYVPSLDQYYFHYFAESQADLNWANPELRKEIANICNFWLSKGCGGFRLDAIELISKDIEKGILIDGKKYQVQYQAHFLPSGIDVSDFEFEKLKDLTEEKIQELTVEEQLLIMEKVLRLAKLSCVWFQIGDSSGGGYIICMYYTNPNNDPRNGEDL